MKALVTGASGFLGQQVVGALIRRGHHVRAMLRPARRREELGWPAGIEIFGGDLRSSQNLHAAFDGIDVLVHLAASVTGPEEEQFASTVIGTERLLTAATQSSCRRLVLASSFAVYDWSIISGTLNEDSPVERSPDIYARDTYSITKSWQERIARRFAEKHGWDLTVLRPGFIWGREHAYLAALGQQMGPIHLVIGPMIRMPMTHVENCADLFALAATDSRACGHTFNVVDGQGERIWSFLGRYLRGTEQRGVRIPIPYTLAYGVIRAAFATLFRKNDKLPQILIPCRFESRLKPLRYTNQRAREILGWTPPLSFRECLARTFAHVPASPVPPHDDRRDHVASPRCA